MRRVLAFYKFTDVEELEPLRDELLQTGIKLGLKGTILIAHEGVNGTVVGTTSALNELTQCLQQRFGEIPFKWSDLAEDNRGFFRFKVKIKPEIVSFGVADLDLQQTGEHVNAQRWNELLADPDVVVIDTRNDYECAIGSFRGAIDPSLDTFRDFPRWAEANLDPAVNRKVAMFCTGGIRCEKASSYLLEQGFEQVFHLRGGILKYLEEVPPEDSIWEGECFVFDNRVAVDHKLEKGRYDQCYGCRHPITEEDKLSDKYQKGVCCPGCYGRLTPDQKARFAERQKQIELAAQRGEVHVGAPAPARQEPKPEQGEGY